MVKERKIGRKVLDSLGVRKMNEGMRIYRILRQFGLIQILNLKVYIES